MCLDSVERSETTSEPVTAWKVFYRKQKGFVTSPFFETHIPENTWTTDLRTGRVIISGLAYNTNGDVVHKEESYDAGFHCFLSEDSAQNYRTIIAGLFFLRSGQPFPIEIRKVLLKGTLTYGVDGGCPAIVGTEILVLP